MKSLSRVWLFATPWTAAYQVPLAMGFSRQEYCLVKGRVFPVVMFGCESWTIKKTECWRIDAYELWHWRRLLRVTWIARRSNQSILKDISLEYSLEGLILKLKVQDFWPPDAKNWLTLKDPVAGEDWRQEKGTTEDKMASPTQRTWVLASSGRR